MYIMPFILIQFNSVSIDFILQLCISFHHHPYTTAVSVAQCLIIYSTVCHLPVSVTKDEV